MRIRIRGTVQGVGFRPAVFRTASSLGLNGSVWNDGPDVMVEIDDDKGFIDLLRNTLPALAVIDTLEKENVPFSGTTGFRIAGSTDGSGGVSIPTDSAICVNCVADMKEGRRKDYEFTTCTDCGARFTLLSSLPYDRCNTAMNDFKMCEKCRLEYNDPGNRRFHHQTICCPECGPRYHLTDGKMIITDDPIKKFAEQLENGMIGVAKSWGGMHICALPERIGKLREWYRRPQKPFALMVRDVDSVRKYAEPNDLEIEQLTSVHRPIVLMKKKYGDITEGISPGLDTIGTFLPYTGMHHKLFDHLRTDALIMTSANVPGEPMILNDGVFELNADVYLLHDQTIINRADDSVLRINGKRTAFLRRSRGHIPSYIRTSGKNCAAGLGAHENITASVAFEGRIHSTQHIGDGDSAGVPEFLDSAAHSLIQMLKCEPSVIAVDLHPGYSNRALGRSMKEEFKAKMIEVQHHWAHAASLLEDNQQDECVALTLDGNGYGDDGNAWGGEVMIANMEGYERVAHLQNIPLLGSEKALYDIGRLKFAVDEMNGTDSKIFDDNTSRIFRKMAKNSVRTSSFGRLLDTLAFTLGVCEKRTYDGEPAMKMEPLLARGKMIEGFETEMDGMEILTADLFTRIRKGQNKNDIAYSIVRNVLNVMVSKACDTAGSKGIRNIGLTGGVSYNNEISSMVRQEVKARGFVMLEHERIPNGDGGISVGQAAIASRVAL